MLPGSHLAEDGCVEKGAVQCMRKAGIGGK